MWRDVRYGEIAHLDEEDEIIISFPKARGCIRMPSLGHVACVLSSAHLLLQHPLGCLVQQLELADCEATRLGDL